MSGSIARRMWSNSAADIPLSRRTRHNHDWQSCSWWIFPRPAGPARSHRPRNWAGANVMNC